MADVIHLIRHGEVHNPDNVCYADIETFGLSELGWTQARQVGVHLALITDTVLSACHVSPLRRARETWAGTDLDVKPMLNASLTEWGLAQRWKGHRWDELDELFPGEVAAYWEHPTELAFSSESISEVAKRMTREIRAANDAHPTGSIAIVSHQDPVQAARLALTGRSLADLHVDKPDHGSVITLVPRHLDEAWVEEAHWRPSPEPSRRG